MDLTDAYVASYAVSHQNPSSFEYRFGYWKLGLIDFLLSDYRYLDVGCGTAGYFSLMERAEQLVGIDRSPKMIAMAETLARESAYGEKTRFYCGEFNDSFRDEPFDFIRLGVFGTYEPLRLETLELAYRFLRPGGMALLNFSPTNGIASRTVNRHIVLTPSRLRRLLRKHEGFEICGEWQVPGGYVALLGRL